MNKYLIICDRVIYGALLVLVIFLPYSLAMIASCQGVIIGAWLAKRFNYEQKINRLMAMKAVGVYDYLFGPKAKEEILAHKWYESERAGHDVGWELALQDWINKHGASAFVPAVRKAIEIYKWEESEKAGYDIGWERAIKDWITNQGVKVTLEKDAGSAEKPEGTDAPAAPA